jgi:hypothetical protein
MRLKVIINIFAKNPSSIAFAIAAILYVLAIIYATAPIHDKNLNLTNNLIGYA